MTAQKTPEEIELMKISGEICAKALKKVLAHAKVGVRAIDLDTLAREEIELNGGNPSFMTVEDYKWTTCITFNEQVVHGIPTKRKIKEGDVLSIDIGAIYKNYHSDMAKTIAIGKVSDEIKKFIDTGSKALTGAIDKARAGNHIGDISATLQRAIEGKGYSVVRNLTGHGIGKELHEEPMVPGFGKKGLGPEIKDGMTLAIEAIYAQESGDVFLEEDNWTISTKDKSVGGLFEQTVAVTKSGPIVLTPYL